MKTIKFKFIFAIFVFSIIASPIYLFSQELKGLKDMDIIYTIHGEKIYCKILREDDRGYWVKRYGTEQLFIYSFVEGVKYADEMEFPVDSISQLITYTEVFKFPGYTKEKLFLKAKTWAAQQYVSVRDVIQYEDKKEGIMILKGYFIVSHKIGSWFFGFYDQSQVHSLLKIEFKEERAKITLTGFAFRWIVNTSNQTIRYEEPIENFYPTGTYRKKNKEYEKYNDYFKQIDSRAKKMIAGFN